MGLKLRLGGLSEACKKYFIESNLRLTILYYILTNFLFSTVEHKSSYIGSVVYCFNNNWYKGVVCAADFRALAIE